LPLLGTLEFATDAGSIDGGQRASENKPLIGYPIKVEPSLALPEGVKQVDVHGGGWASQQRSRRGKIYITVSSAKALVEANTLGP